MFIRRLADGYNRNINILAWDTLSNPPGSTFYVNRQAHPALAPWGWLGEGSETRSGKKETYSCPGQYVIIKTAEKVDLILYIISNLVAGNIL